MSRITIILLLVMSSWCYLVAQPVSKSYKFKQITVEDGLSNNSVNCITKCSKGFMWFGTLGGLNRYDGTSFKVFQHDYRDSLSLPHNDILTIMEDRKERFWIQTRSGFAVFDSYTEKFHSNYSSFLAAIGVKEPTINGLFIDRLKNFWIVTPHKELLKVDPQTLKITPIRLEDPSGRLFSFYGRTSFCQDKEDNIWVINSLGKFAKINTRKNKINHVNQPPLERG